MIDYYIIHFFKLVEHFLIEGQGWPWPDPGPTLLAWRQPDPGPGPAESGPAPGQCNTCQSKGCNKYPSGKCEITFLYLFCLN